MNYFIKMVKYMKIKIMIIRLVLLIKWKNIVKKMI